MVDKVSLQEAPTLALKATFSTVNLEILWVKMLCTTIDTFKFRRLRTTPSWKCFCQWWANLQRTYPLLMIMAVKVEEMPKFNSKRLYRLNLLWTEIFKQSSQS
jgi:hypothetical protein